FRNERGEWVDPARVAEALRRLADLRAARFVEAPVPAPAAPRHIIEASAAGEGPFTLATHASRCTVSGEELVDRRGPSGVDWMCVDGAALVGAREALVMARTRDDRLTGVPAEAATAVELDADGRRLELRRAGGRWTFARPSVRYAADTAVVDAPLRQLADVPLHFPPPPPASRPAPPPGVTPP